MLYYLYKYYIREDKTGGIIMEITKEYEEVHEGESKELTREEVQEEQAQEKRKLIDRIMRGKNDMFIKHYNLPEYNIEFTVHIQAPNAIESGKIQAKTARYLDGMNLYSSQYYVVVYQTLAILRICGRELPEYLEKDENIYNLDILYLIGVDFAEWLSTFESKVKQYGGLKQLAKEPYMRNMWVLIKTLNMPPTDPRFLALDDAQVELMLYSLEEDAKAIERARRGVQVEDENFDSSFDDKIWNKAAGEWQMVEDGHDMDEIARQVNAMTAAKDRADLEGKFDGIEGYNEHLENGGMTSREAEVSNHIANQLAKAEQRARELESGATSNKDFIDDRERAGEVVMDEEHRLNKQAMDEAIAAFEDDDDYDVL
ncbi:tail assembly chaperone [Bacillus phage Darren]|nr:tail assembly chaperone [Bacillus phage Darren]